MPETTLPWRVMWSVSSKILRYSLYSRLRSSIPFWVILMRCLRAPRSRTMYFSSRSSSILLDADCWLISSASPSSLEEMAM